MSGVITVTIDGQLCSAAAGKTILEVARENGIDIPTLCQFEGLSNVGACRLCLVQINESPRLQPSCVVRAEDEMRVATNTPQIQSYRKMIVELLLSERNHICAVCVMNGSCELQTMAARLGVDHVRYDYLTPKLTVDATHERFVLDHNRCILCSRCVRTCEELEGAHVWDFARRGISSYVITELARPWGEAITCTSCGKCVNACPTGALTHKGDTVAESRKEPNMLKYLLQARRTGEYQEDMLAPLGAKLSVAVKGRVRERGNGEVKPNG